MTPSIVRTFATLVLANVFFMSLPDIAQDTPNDGQQSVSAMIEQLASSETSQQAINDLRQHVRQNPSSHEDVLDRLVEVAETSDSLVQRGWAIAALAEVGGQGVDELLLNIHADEDHEAVVRAWAAAARVSMTKTAAGLIEKANLITEFPSLGRPIGLRLVDKLTNEGDANAEKVIGVVVKVPKLMKPLAPAILAFGQDKLAEVMITANNQRVRRTAASFLATYAQQGRGDPTESVIDLLKFNAQADQVPWANGPLFIPQLQWGQKDARQLVGQLLRWMVWCDQRNANINIHQIHNNIRSLSLARAAGYESPGWNRAPVSHWLKTWGKAVGDEQVREILAEQDIAPDRYPGALN